MPTFVVPSFKLGMASVIQYFIKKLQYFIACTASWNVMKYPTGNVPVTIAREDETTF